MCRLVAYLGRATILANVLVAPKNSLVMQSLHARETPFRTNGDGFGVGWYAPEISTDPALFTSIAPAWNDRNLLYLTAKIQSPCFFAHVRSASSGGVSTYNCHPFVYGDWMLMHNGEIYDFIKVKRHLRHLLDDEIYDWIKGDTDSEHLFALFLQLSKNKDLTNITTVADILQDTFKTIQDLIQQFGTKGPSYFNVCLTDGRRVIATRYCTYLNRKPLSLHYLVGHSRVTEELISESNQPTYVVVSSERLNDIAADWCDVPEQKMMLIDEDKSIQWRDLA